MNYYKRHLGDYAKDTGHLTALEHGVYTLLLDWYYANERAIPDSLTIRIARGNPEETQTVLSEFFQKTDAGWVHNYADRVIAEYNAKADRNRASGLLGGRPKKTQTVSEANPQETLATSHKPLAISQEEKQKKAPATRAVVIEGVSESVANDFTAMRKAKKAPITETALAFIKREADKAGYTLEQALETSCARGWVGFKAEWVAGAAKPNGNGVVHIPAGGGRREL